MLPFGGALLLAMVAAWAIALSLLTNVIDEQLEARLENTTATLAEGVFPLTPDLVERVDRLIEARVLLLGANGDVQLSTGDDAVNEALIGLDLPDESAPRIVTVEADGQAWKLAVQRLAVGRDDRYAFVAAAASLEESRAVAREAALLLAAAMLVAALFLALFASFFVRSITRPVADLATLADRIAEGERDIVTSIDEDNEIGVLGKAFNDMASKIDDYETELAQNSRLSGLGELASRMAHEIRNPLTAMKMQLELLENRIDDAHRQRVNTLLDEVRRLELVIDNALAVGGGNSINPAPTDASQLINDVADLLQPELEHRDIALVRDVPVLPAMALDAHRMKQVLLNLINNAADELDKGGTIAISAIAKTGVGVEIHVEDSGPGIRDTYEVSGKPLGLGLGLKISSEIVEGHQGELQSSSSEILGGAKFTIRLPASIMSVPST